MKGPNQVAPGHRLVITQNCRGLKSENRLDHCLASLCLLSPDVIMLQETGLHKDTDAPRLRKLANRWQYAVAASYITSTSTRGGTAVLLRREAFGLKPNVEIDPKWIKRGMGGGYTVVTLPNGDSFASVYVPVQAPLRMVFLRRLREAHVITRRTIVGADRNSVSNTSLDVRYPAGKDGHYSNQHARKWDELMSNLSLCDVFRHLRGSRARMYTRLGPTVHTRIDCLFGPASSHDNRWYTIECRDLGRASWSSDHLAVMATMKTDADAQVEKGKGRPRIRPEIFEDDTAREAIACMYKEVRIAYPPSEYGHKATWRKSMVIGVCH